MNSNNYNKKAMITKRLNIIKNIVIYIFLTSWALMVLFPFFWMIITSLKTRAEYNSETIPHFYAIAPTFVHYKDAFIQEDMLRFITNTTFYALFTTFLMVIVSILAAFAFARLEFKGKNLVFTLFLAMMMIPNELIIITNYQTITNLNMRDTFSALILPSTLSVFYIYLLRQNFMQVPDAMYYASKVDGANDFQYLLKMLIPLSKPTIITITILKIIECWNAYIWPKLVTTEESHFIVSNAIQMIKQNGFGRDNIPGMMAAVTIVSIPLIITFIIFRKQIMSGVRKTGTKG